MTEGRADVTAGLDAYYDSMFREREAVFPEALHLDFWRDHFILRACRESGVLRGRVVDLACGTGEVDVLLPTQVPAVESVCGVDISDVGLAHGRRHLAAQPPAVRDRVRFRKADIEATGLPGGAFDAALLSHTLEHLANPAPALRELARLLAPGARALVVVPYEHHHDDPDHKRHLDPDGYRALLSRYADIESSWVSGEGDQIALVVRPRLHARVVVMVRARDEERLLPGLLDNVRPLADGAVVLDDRSGDATAAVATADPLVRAVLRNDVDVTDEVRDKNALLDVALAEPADWVLAMDADERLEEGGAAFVRRVLDSAPPWADCLAVDCAHLWDVPARQRFDGAYGRDIRHPRLFDAATVRERGLRFRASPHGGGFHCGSVPGDLAETALPLPIRLLHLGYLGAPVRERKAAFYAREDPAYAARGYYDHLRTEPTLLLPVVDRRAALDATAWTWPALDARPGIGALPDGASVVLVDAAVPATVLRALRETRALYVVQAGGRGSAWVDLVVPGIAAAFANVPVDTAVVAPRTAARSLPAILRAGLPLSSVYGVSDAATRPRLRGLDPASLRRWLGRQVQRVRQ